MASPNAPFKTIVEFHPETGSKRPFEVYIVNRFGDKKIWSSFADEKKALAKAAKNNAWLASEGILQG